MRLTGGRGSHEGEQPDGEGAVTKPAVGAAIEGPSELSRQSDGLDAALLARHVERLLAVAHDANRSRAMPWVVVLLGTLLLVFWAAAGLLPDGRAWPTTGESVAGIVVGGVLICVGGALALLSDVLPARQVAKAAQALNEHQQLQGAERNRLAEMAERQRR